MLQYEVFINQSAIAGILLFFSMVIQFSNCVRQYIHDREPTGMPLDYVHPAPARYFIPLSGGWQFLHLFSLILGYGLLIHYLIFKYLP